MSIGPAMARSEVQSDLELYLREISVTPLLTPEEERDLGCAVLHDNCPHARDRMIRSNLRLVVAIAKNYSNRGLSLGDLIEEGNLGLLKAVENFDPHAGARFCTYASWWIKQAIKRALLSATRPIHVPAYMVELIARWKIASRELETTLGHAPSIEELAKHMDLPVRKIRIIKRAVRSMRSAGQEPLDSYGDLLGMGATIADDRAVTPDEGAFQEEEIRTLRKLLDSIDQREAEVLRLRFGLDGREPMTLKQISSEVGLSRERVRQVVDEALTRLNAQLNDDQPSRFFKENRIPGRPMEIDPSKISRVGLARGARAAG